VQIDLPTLKSTTKTVPCVSVSQHGHDRCFALKLFSPARKNETAGPFARIKKVSVPEDSKSGKRIHTKRGMLNYCMSKIVSEMLRIDARLSVDSSS
jgi:hypothetical protein